MATRKQKFFSKLIKFVDEYSKILIVHADNVGSSHLQQIRIGLRGKADILMGKNTMTRKAIKGQLSKNPDLEALLPHIRGNVGFVFTNEDLKNIRDEVACNTVEAPARVGGVAPRDVFVDAGTTPLDPSFTGFMQSLGISTKISRGFIEILSKIHLIKEGEKVTSSQASLLQKLSIHPFSYGLVPLQVYEAGVCYPPKVLDTTETDVLKKVSSAIQNLAALSLASNIPTASAIPHYFGRAYGNLVAVSLATDYTFERVKDLKELLDDPEALAALAASTPAAAAAEEVVAEDKPAEPEAAAPEEEEEDEDAGFMDLFG